MQLLAAEGIHQHQLNVQKSTRFIGIKVGKSNYSKNELNETKLPVRVIAQTAKTRSGWDTVLEGTEFKTTLSGADIQAGVGEKARADAKIILKGIVNRIQTEEKLESNSTVWQKQAGSGSTVETLKLPSFEGPALPKLTAPGGYIADIPKGNLKTEIEKLAKQPEYAYLKQLQTVKDVNWNQVQLAYDKWDYKQEGKCQDGAIGAAVGEIVGEALVKNTDFSRMSATEIEKAKAKITAYSKLVAGTASAVVGGDVNTAANAAQIAVENNTLYPRCVGAKCDEFQKEQQKWIRENPEEYREVLLLQTGFIPIIGDIQSFVQAQTAADHLFALLGVVPGIGESIQAYKVAKAAKNLQGMKKALDKAATVATAQGYVSKTKIKIGQTELRVTAATDKQLLKAIGEGRDTTGKMTEQLFDSVAKQNGFRVLSGGKYGGNNGFDHVWQAADGSVVLIVESKQIRNGTVQLNPNGAGGYTQMSEDWIKQVANSLPDGSPAKAAVFKAEREGKLKTAIAGVDRQTGKAVIIPVKVLSKANIRR
ncbi:S-layer family protein [Neisseria meningitidis]|nr:S-layer family protein [Neisseria meningitidis]